MALIVLGTVLLIWVYVRLNVYRRIKKWASVTGKIVRAETEDFQESNVNVIVTLVRPVIEYRYNYEGHEYIGSRISPEDHSLKESCDSPNPVWNKWTLYGEFPVAVNPANPGESYLAKDLLPHRRNHYAALCIAGILLISIGIALEYFSS